MKKKSPKKAALKKDLKTPRQPVPATKAAKPASPAAFPGLDAITLSASSHSDRMKGLCAMEAVAWIAGEEHSDHPECVSPSIGAFMRSWNDGLPSNEERDRLLKPFLPKIIGTVASQAVEERRSYMCIDWTVRTYTPLWLDLAGLVAEAAELRALAPITNLAMLHEAEPLLKKSSNLAYEKWSAAYSAADSAARSAAYSAADSAADSAAYSAAYSARNAAYSAAYSARSAARSAAREAATAALKSTVDALQASAQDLLERLIAESASTIGNTDGVAPSIDPSTSTAGGAA